MIKRTLIAIAAMAFVASLAFASTDVTEWGPNGELDIWNHTHGDSAATKVDGSIKVRWPFKYEDLEICRIPVYMHIGMYIKVIDCDKYKVVLKQVDCADLRAAKNDDNIEDKDWPCYEGCAKHKDSGSQGIKVISNFPAVLSAKFYKLVGDDGKAKDGGKVIGKSGASASPEEINASTETKVDICVWAWETKLEQYGAGDEVRVGDVAVQARPQI